MRKLDAAESTLPCFVVDPESIGRLPRYNPEELNVVAMDHRIRTLEKHINTLDANVVLKTANYDSLEEDVNVMKLAVGQHTERFRRMEPSRHRGGVLPPPSGTVKDTGSSRAAVPNMSAQANTDTSNSATTSGDSVSSSVSNIPAIRPADNGPSHDGTASADHQSDNVRSYSGVAGELNEQPGHIGDKFTPYRPPRRRRKDKIVSGKSTTGNTFEGAPALRRVFLFHVNSQVNDEQVKEHMDGKTMNYVSIKTMSNPDSTFKSFLITVNTTDYENTLNPELWPPNTRLRDFRMPQGGRNFNNHGAQFP